MCSDPRHPFYADKTMRIGYCPVCGEICYIDEKENYFAVDACFYSPVECEYCESSPCVEAC